MGTKETSLKEALPSPPTVRAPWGRMRRAWQRFRAWRRIRFTQMGGLFSLGALAVGLAAINTGNNLLYLLLGAMLGFIAVSGWLSEQVIRNLEVRRRTPRGVTVGNPLRIQYSIRNHRVRIPSFALEVEEEGLPGHAYLPFLAPGEAGTASSVNRFVRRGIFPLRAVTVSTSFPFGLFKKSRDLALSGELVIWPRTDRRTQLAPPSGGRNLRIGAVAPGLAGPRGEYRGLRDYRPGDDPRDIHWRTSARLGQPLVREYEQNDAETLWICLDTRGSPGERAENAVEVSASLAAKAFQAGKEFGFHAPGITVEPGSGTGQLERVLDALARVDFSPSGPGIVPPGAPMQSLLVSFDPGEGGSFRQVFPVGPVEQETSDAGTRKSWRAVFRPKRS